MLKSNALDETLVSHFLSESKIKFTFLSRIPLLNFGKLQCTVVAQSL